MRELILLLLLLLSSCLGVRAGRDEPAAPSPTLVPHPRLLREVLVVEDVDAFALGSYPMQIRLAVRGYWPSGCTADVQVEQRLEADTLTVAIWRALPAGAVCPAVIVPYNETIAIEGGFTRLPAVIAVNGWMFRADS